MSTVIVVSCAPGGACHESVNVTDCITFSRPSSDCETVWYGAARSETPRLAESVTLPFM